MCRNDVATVLAVSDEALTTKEKIATGIPRRVVLWPTQGEARRHREAQSAFQAKQRVLRRTKVVIDAACHERRCLASK